MRKISVGLILVAGMAAGCTQMPAGPTSAAREGVLTREAVVESVDLETRQILMTGETGRKISVLASDEVRNLDQLEPGDRVRLAYYEAVALKMADPSDPGGGVAVAAGNRASPGNKPGVAAGAIANFVVEFLSYDPESGIATFIGPNDVVYRVKVHPEMREFAAGRQTGDRIEATIEQAVAISVTEMGG